MYFLKTDYLLQYSLLHVNGYSQCLKVRLLSWQGVAYIIMHQQSEGRETEWSEKQELIKWSQRGQQSAVNVLQQ